MRLPQRLGLLLGVLTYFTSEWVTQASGSTNHQNASTPQQLAMPPPKQAKSSNQEGRILLAKQAVELGQIQSIRGAADEFDVHFETLR
jgi:hypothetical protein